ncbi:RraA family protein [Priestia aryabhattai]|uniref:RraA family protein n=1 Tax=Priestia aryabhattai TaxID=412384 RepID=UPI0036A94024
MVKINSVIQRPNPELLKKLGSVSPSDYGHRLNFQLIHSRKIKPLFRFKGNFAGPAITVRIPPNDGSLVYKALGLVMPGDVVVIDMNEEERFACWGEITTRVAMEKGALAVIINGPVTDTDIIKELGFKVFSYAISPLTTKMYNLDGDVNVPISISGCIIKPGDIVVGSMDGLLVVPQEDISTYLEIGEEEAKADQERREDLKRLGVETYLNRFNPLWNNIVEKTK